MAVNACGGEGGTYFAKGLRISISRVRWNCLDTILEVGEDGIELSRSKDLSECSGVLCWGSGDDSEKF